MSSSIFDLTDSFEATLHGDDLVVTVILRCDGARSESPAEVFYQEVLSDKGRELCKGVRAEQGTVPSWSTILINAKYLAKAEAECDSDDQ